MRARVLVKPKAGILDPQGQAVERALPALGFTGVRNVHVGRLIELDVEDPARLPEMCQRLLTNPLIEDYEIVEADGDGDGDGDGHGAANGGGAGPGAA
ncbi:MAG TPA: phosphoribosylformylglycinamidine synthase subunit PurS [Solirubrobacteraceae bacterium]|nr:phosphoribosylformylglycinamidine synthase subunit PurS [Solirubrobacteraceae bacterium]